MILGNRIGCHQKPERSFYYCSYQFPVCSRCTGVTIGYLLSISMFVYRFNIIVYLLLASIMLIDWLIQYIKLKESTNIRRLITGIIGGYGIMGIYVYIIEVLCKLIVTSID